MNLLSISSKPMLHHSLRLCPDHLRLTAKLPISPRNFKPFTVRPQVSSHPLGAPSCGTAYHLQPTHPRPIHRLRSCPPPPPSLQPFVLDVLHHPRTFLLPLEAGL
ncbi:hypothetical protein LIA77_10040 [Sarocladium implicatum]|nr:hypothetical protein LIA77_10040 [Sarocladium implicatum]